MKKWITTFCIVILCIVLMAAGLLAIRLRHGVKIRAEEEHPLAGQVFSYRQDDEAWAKDSLGNSSYTMKSSGCLVTCIASAVSGYEAVTPGELNDLFSRNGVYDSEGNIQWDEVAKLDGYYVTTYDGVSGKDIENCLKDGHYPIVRVRMHGLGNNHYVLILGTDEEGQFLCMDPLEDELTKLSDYLGLVYAVRCVWKED